MASEFLAPFQQRDQLFAPSVAPMEAASTIRYALGKIIGGGSAVNAAIALHGWEEDYSAWAALGNDFWSWGHVQPVIDALESTENGGPVLSIEMPSPTDYTVLQSAFREACIALGFPVSAQRGGSSVGVHTLPRSTLQGRRVSTSTTCLAPARTRKNLTVVCGSHVDKLLIVHESGKARAVGVEAIVAGTRVQLLAGHVVLSAGAIHSPAILLRSGIGSAAQLARHGIETFIDLPGVGRNLADHPVVSVWGIPEAGTFKPGENIHQLMLQLCSSNSAQSDLALFMISGVPTSAFPPLGDFLGSEFAAGIAVALTNPKSQGYVELASRDPFIAPVVKLNCLLDQEDLRTMMEGVRLAWKVMHQTHLESKIDITTFWNQAIIDSDVLLSNAVLSSVRGSWHPVGTLRMGGAADRTAVVDQYGRLHGCLNVTVADASVMPKIPSVPTSPTCMLIAERLAALLSSDFPATVE